MDIINNVQLVEEYAAKEDAEVVVICARVEEEVAELEEEEKQVFLEEMGIETSGLDILIQKAYHLLGLANLLHCWRTRSSCLDFP